jgi:mono/diheme cytochrome c family protein
VDNKKRVIDMKTVTKLTIGFGLMAVGVGAALGDGWNPHSNATETGSIVNTRHNLTQSYSVTAEIVMNVARNNYGAICVYCHTPHGGNTQINAPLWNRTVNGTAYSLYDKPTTLMRPISQPGPSSLTCLSCHDGTISIDSVLNMPGSGLSPTAGAGANNELNESNIGFLDSWAGNPAGLASAALGHLRLGNGDLSGTPGTGAEPGLCTLCHQNNGRDGHGNDLLTMSSFDIFALGTDLRDDHPIGVIFPETFAPEADFYEPDVKIPGKMAFFDTNGDNYANPDEVRLYDSGDGYEVECASCHDPHGVPSGGSGTDTRFNPSFLRVNNGVVGTHDGATGITSNGPSALCLTCHAK